jgi:uroporphyrinogen III methyltransferase/synthase
MHYETTVLKVGTRSSALAREQTQVVLDRLQAILPAVVFEVLHVYAPGDMDQQTDLRQSPPDFFTQPLDNGLLNGEIDLAVHSAKDLPDPVPEGLDWFWMPDAGDRRDVLIGTLDPKVIGVSSDRRAAYAQARFPGAVCRSVRGTIEERLRQLDEGRFDLLIMAGVALQRLGLEARITEWIPLDELTPPEAQGALAVTFRQGDRRLEAIRDLFVKAAVFAGAGIGGGSVTLDGVRALQSAEVCLYDALLDEAILAHLPPTARQVYVGKRQGAHSQPQEEINHLLCDHVRRGQRVVRLKGGDPAIFGRLAEEVEALEAFGLASRVLPGISAMQVAASDTGILLTRREVARGFTVMTPRQAGGALAPVGADARAALPVVFYMAVSAAPAIAAELLADGAVKTTPCALVFGAGSDQEHVVRATLGTLSAALDAVDAAIRSLPGLFVVGEIARYGFNTSLGALGGRRILLTCSGDLMPKAVQAVQDFGGRPVVRPLIRLEVLPEAAAFVRQIDQFDWIVLTSPAAVRCFQTLLRQERIDFRRLPGIMATGSGSARALAGIGLACDLYPETDASADGLLAVAAPVVRGKRVLRLRSEMAGTALADGLRKHRAEVEDVVLYVNRPVPYPDCPVFDTVFFASASAVDAFLSQWGRERLAGKTILTMGRPTATALAAHGIVADVTGSDATVEGVIASLARHGVRSCILNGLSIK